MLLFLLSIKFYLLTFENKAENKAAKFNLSNFNFFNITKKFQKNFIQSLLSKSETYT